MKVFGTGPTSDRPRVIPEGICGIWRSQGDFRAILFGLTFKWLTARFHSAILLGVIRVARCSQIQTRTNTDKVRQTTVPKTVPTFSPFRLLFRGLGRAFRTQSTNHLAQNLFIFSPTNQVGGPAHVYGINIHLLRI
jgi:hypothetical protein